MVNAKAPLEVLTRVAVSSVELDRVKTSRLFPGDAPQALAPGVIASGAVV